MHPESRISLVCLVLLSSMGNSYARTLHVYLVLLSSIGNSWKVLGFVLSCCYSKEQAKPRRPQGVTPFQQRFRRPLPYVAAGPALEREEGSSPFASERTGTREALGAVHSGATRSISSASVAGSGGLDGGSSMAVAQVSGPRPCSTPCLWWWRRGPRRPLAYMKPLVGTGWHRHLGGARELSHSAVHLAFWHLRVGLVWWRCHSMLARRWLGETQRVKEHPAAVPPARWPWR